MIDDGHMVVVVVVVGERLGRREIKFPCAGQARAITSPLLLGVIVRLFVFCHVGSEFLIGHCERRAA